MQPDTGELVSILGVQVQFAGSLLCVGLGLSLRRGAGPRPWFDAWVWSFVALAIAIGALTVRYFVLPSLPFQRLPTGGAIAALFATYFAAKLAFLVLLLRGTWGYARRTAPPLGWWRAAWVAVAGGGLLALTAGGDLNALVGWQAILAVPVFAVCARLVFRVPRELATRGSRTLGFVFTLLAALWALYLPAFLGVGEGSTSLPGRILVSLAGHNSYVDVLFQFLLAFGIILALLDDIHRDTETVRTDRLRDLAASEARLAQLIRSASEGIVLLDLERRIVHLNRAAEEMLRRPAAELLGAAFDRFVAEPDRPVLWESLEVPVRRSEAYPAVAARREITGVRAGGDRFPMEVSLSGMDADQPEGFVLVLRDGTERVRLQEERERMQAQLAQAARMETIGRMVSGVAHELNNPLTAILAFGQDLLHGARTPEDREALTTIVQQSQRCRAIVQDLLTFARTRREDRERVAPYELAARVTRVFERDSARHGVQLEIAVPEGLPAVPVNPTGVEQVLTNLLSNAIDAAGPGGRVSLRAGVQGERVEFIVEDSGPGIPPDVLPRIFEPFFTTKAPGQGTGLGLSVSHAIVEQHDGEIRVENLPGAGAPVRGTRFTVSIPFIDRRSVRREAPRMAERPAGGVAIPPATDPVRPAPPAAARSPVPPAPAAGPPAPAALRRVLVIDDEAPIRVAIRRYLERRGWTVDEAGDGREALGFLGLDGGTPRPDHYHAIVTDLKMPGMTGIALYDRLEQDCPAALKRLVVISGDTASAEVADFMGRLRRPIVQKPFDMRALADLLERTALLGS